MERAKPDTQPKTTIEDRPDSKDIKPKAPLKRYGLKPKVAADKKPAEGLLAARLSVLITPHHGPSLRSRLSLKKRKKSQFQCRNRRLIPTKTFQSETRF
jgi:hypothetical protein